MRSPVWKSLISGVVLLLSAVGFAPQAGADPGMFPGNYTLHMPDRRDFHTWILSMTTYCPVADPTVYARNLDCLNVITIPQPIAKAEYSRADAHLVDGRYTLVIDDPFGLRCGDIYFGPVIPTHDVYTWDAHTLAGQMVSTFDAGCDGAPGGTLTYPFTLSRM